MKEQPSQKCFWLRKEKFMLCAENLFILMSITCLFGHSNAQSVALCYAYDPNVTALSKFDWAVVDSYSKFNSSKDESLDSNTIWLSYVSVGEVQTHRSYYEEMPRDWLIGDNPEWNSFIINQTAPGWPAFFVDKVVAPIWNNGFKGFFLDTLDSYQRVATTDAERQAQEEGLAQVILALNENFPDALVIFNRGFEIISRVHQVANMVAFESLFAGWNQAQEKFVSVDQNDRDWLLAQVGDIKNKYKLPILAIDYCPPDNSTCVQNTVRQIMEQGIVPYVTDPMLQTVGVGPNVN